MKDNVLIKVEDLKKHYLGGKVKALDGINAEIKKGEVIVIIGPSGSGKSTFLRSLNLLELPTDGKIIFDGEDITAAHVNINRHRQKMGMVFQHFNLFPHLTILRNMTIAPMKLNKLSKEDAENKALELLDRVGLKDRANSYPSQLSGGQKQRIAIARIFLKNPPILILDEATSALDSVTEAKIQRAFDALSVGRTTLIIAHRLSTIRAAGRIVSIADGRITECGSHEELLKQDGIYAKLYRTQNSQT